MKQECCKDRQPLVHQDKACNEKYMMRDRRRFTCRNFRAISPQAKHQKALQLFLDELQMQTPVIECTLQQFNIDRHGKTHLLVVAPASATWCNA